MRPEPIMRTARYAIAAVVIAVVAGGIAWFAWFKHDALRRDFGGLPDVESIE